MNNRQAPTRRQQQTARQQPAKLWPKIVRETHGHTEYIDLADADSRAEFATTIIGDSDQANKVIDHLAEHGTYRLAADTPEHVETFTVLTEEEWEHHTGTSPHQHRQRRAFETGTTREQLEAAILAIYNMPTKLDITHIIETAGYTNTATAKAFAAGYQQALNETINHIRHHLEGPERLQDGV